MAKGKQEQERMTVGQGGIKVELALGLRLRDDGIWEAGIAGKTGEQAEVGFGASPSEAIRRAVKRNAARLGRSIPAQAASKKAIAKLSS